MGRHGRTIEQRFWDLVQWDGLDGCWPWQGAKTKRGYGKFAFKRDGKYVCVRANRFAWELANGRTIPANLEAMHSCDIPSCCNPRHISPGTRQDNMSDCVSKGRTAAKERHSSAVLTGNEVATIRAYYATGTFTHRKLALMFGVSHTAIGMALRRKTWR